MSTTCNFHTQEFNNSLNRIRLRHQRSQKFFSVFRLHTFFYTRRRIWEKQNRSAIRLTSHTQAPAYSNSHNTVARPARQIVFRMHEVTCTWTSQMNFDARTPKFSNRNNLRSSDKASAVPASIPTPCVNHAGKDTEHEAKNTAHE